MQRLIVVLSMVLGACSMPDSSYTLDGVPVVLEHSKGPPQHHLAHAMDLYRRAAEEHWALSDDEERAVWRGLTEIRWTDDQVPHDADYDAYSATLRATWYGCALAVPLYQAISFHYAGEGLTSEDLEWAKGLEDTEQDAVCIESDSSMQLPW